MEEILYSYQMQSSNLHLPVVIRAHTVKHKHVSNVKDIQDFEQK